MKVNGTQQNGGGELEQTRNGFQNLHTLSSENVLRNKLGNAKLKGKLLNHVKPVTPPQSFGENARFDKLPVLDNAKSTSSTPRRALPVTPFSALLANATNDETVTENHSKVDESKESENETPSPQVSRLAYQYLLRSVR